MPVLGLREMCDSNLQMISQKVMALVSTAPDAPDALAETEKILEAASVDGVLDGSRALELATQRAKGVLIPHLLGHTSFMGLDLTCEPGVFTTRKETELLGLTAIEKLCETTPAPHGSLQTLRVIDLGSGAGNLTCAIAKALPRAKVWAIDIDSACVSLTRLNVEKHGLADRVDVLLGDLFAPLAGRGLEGTIDAVVSNPPYIASVRLQKDRAYLLANEPRAAFDGGPFGISILMRLVKESLVFLRPGGWLFFEFGVGQDRQVKQLIERAGGYDVVDFVRNQQDEARVSVNRKQNEDR